MGTSTADGYAVALHDAFDEAADAAGHGQVDVDLAGRHLRLRFVGAELEQRLAPAFAHLGPPPAGSTPSLNIDALDRGAAPTPVPPPPWDLDRYGTRERIVGLDDDDLLARFDSGHGLLSTYRPGSGRATFVTGSADDVPRWVVRMPFRHLLGWWADEVGCTLVHAAAVGGNGACVLLPGASGSGKSTTALAAAEAGLDFLGDDLCLLDPTSPGGPTAHALFGWAKAEADAVERIPALGARIVATEEHQSLLRPPNLVRSARVVGIGLPHVAGGTTSSTRPATPAEALFALAPSTLVEGNGAGKGSFAILARLSRTLPAAHLDLGTDMGGVATAVADLAERWST